MAKEEQTVFQQTYDERAIMMRKLLSPEGKPATYIDCVIAETGEMFTAEIQPSNRYPTGRVVTLSNVTYPPSFVPDSVPRDANSPERKRWIYENHWKKLLQQFVGKPASSLTIYRKDMQDKLRKLEEEATKLGLTETKPAPVESKKA